MNFLKSQKTIDWSLVILLNFMWATQVPVVRFIGENNRSIGPMMLAFIPLILSTIIFLPVLWMENKKRNIGMRWRWRDIKYFLVSGIIGIFILQYAYTLGSLKTLAANAGIITLTIPVLVAIFASFMLNEKLNIVRIVSFILAIGGVLLTSVSDISGADFIHGQYLEGNLIFLFACLCCAFYNTYCKVLVEKKYTELEILVYSSIIGSIASIPLLIWVEPFHLTEFLEFGKDYPVRNTWIKYLCIWSSVIIVFLRSEKNGCNPGNPWKLSSAILYRLAGCNPFKRVYHHANDYRGNNHFYEYINGDCLRK